MSLEDDYRARLPQLRATAIALETYLRQVLHDWNGGLHIDIVSARAKGLESFLKKASRYKTPLEDIQDQVGVRVVVYYLRDIAPVKEHLRQFFLAIEDKKAGVTKEDTFGYEAWHCILGVPAHVQEDAKSPVDFFELQVATLFQHAWAQAAHDATYKPGTEVDPFLMRENYSAASLAYCADQVFDRILTALDKKA